MVRREDAMITGKIDPRLQYQGCQSCNEIHRIEGHLGCSVSVYIDAIQKQDVKMYSIGQMHNDVSCPCICPNCQL